MKKWFGYTMIAVAVVLSGCGGGGGGGGGGTPNAAPQPSAGGGTVADGYIAGATVRTQNGQNLGKTDQKGDFRIPQGIKVLPGTILTAQGGYDVATNDPFTGTLKSVYGGNGSEVVISPLTTLVAVKYQQNPGATLDAAVAEVAKALGLPKDAVTADPVKNGYAFIGAQTVMSIAKIIAAAGNGVALQNALEALGQSVQGGDLNWTAALRSVQGPEDMAAEIETAMKKIASMTKALLKEAISHDAVQDTLEDLVDRDIVGAIEKGEDLNDKLDTFSLERVGEIAKVVECLKKHEKSMLGENIDPEHVKYALNLQGVASMCEENDATVSWIEKHGYIDADGTVKRDEHGNVINVDLIAIVKAGDMQVAVKFPLKILPFDNMSAQYIELRNEDVANKLLKVAGYDRSILFGDVQEKTGYLSGDLPGANYNYTLMPIHWRIDDRGQVALTDNQGRSLGALAFEKVPEKGVAGKWTHGDGMIEPLVIASSIAVQKEYVPSVKSTSYLNKILTFEPLGVNIAFSPKNKCWIVRKVLQSRKKIEQKCDWSIVENRLEISSNDINLTVTMRGSSEESVIKEGYLSNITMDLEGVGAKKVQSVVSFIHKVDYYNAIVQYLTNKTHITDVREDINDSVVRTLESSMVFEKNGVMHYIGWTNDGIGRVEETYYWSTADNNSTLIKDGEGKQIAHIDFYNKPGAFGIGSVGVMNMNGKTFPIFVMDHYPINSVFSGIADESVNNRYYRLLDRKKTSISLWEVDGDRYYEKYTRNPNDGKWNRELGVWTFSQNTIKTYDFNNNNRADLKFLGEPKKGTYIEYHDLIDNETDRVLIDTVIPLR